MDWKINFSECVWMVISSIQEFKRIIKQTSFSCFLCGFKIETSVMHEHVMNNQKHMKITWEHLKTFKHIQENLNSYYHVLILNSHHDNTKNKLRKWIIPLSKIHMVEEETVGRDPKGGGKEELGEEEWVTLNTLSLKKTKIWQDYSTSLELKRGEEREFLCVLEWRRGKVYIVVVKEIRMKGHLMRVDKESWT